MIKKLCFFVGGITSLVPRPLTQCLQIPRRGKFPLCPHQNEALLMKLASFPSLPTVQFYRLQCTKIGGEGLVHFITCVDISVYRGFPKPRPLH